MWRSAAPTARSYFTDPSIGRENDRFGVPRRQDLDFEGVFRVGADGGEGRTHEVDEHEFARPNGLCFSPDESILYVNDSSQALIKSFDVAPDGSLSNGGSSARASAPACPAPATATAWSAMSSATSG